MRTIPLHGAKAAGRVALVSERDYKFVSLYRWYVWEIKREGRRTNGPYAVTTINCDGRRVTVFMHKMLTGYARTDHRDHDGLNNQRANLRPATSVQNGQNSRPNLRKGSSQYKGVYWYGRRNNQWFARIRDNGKQVHLGGFRSEEEAALAYDAAALRLHGPYAVLNFPQVKRPRSVQQVLL